MEARTYQINERWEYDYIKNRGFEPLTDIEHFSLPIRLRLQIQREEFGNSYISKGDVVSGNERFYEYVWENKAHYCEECLRPLHNYSSVYISHILSRGAFPEMAHDPRNVNILCFRCHETWENGKRQEMRIYNNNLQTIGTLKKEYGETSPKQPI